MYITVETDPSDIVESLFKSLDQCELKDFILRLDLRMADLGFTESLVKELLRSMDGDIKGSLGNDEYKEYKEGVHKFLKILGEIK